MEEKLVERAEVKLRLDKMVIQQGKAGYNVEYPGMYLQFPFLCHVWCDWRNEDVS